MDCTDIIIASAIGKTSRVLDSYTLSRATPLSDDEYGGQQSISSWIGQELDGQTTVIVRRPLKTQHDPFDHEITPGQMTFIWAKGQEAQMGYSHQPESGLEKKPNAAGAKNFYGSHVLGNVFMNFSNIWNVVSIVLEVW